MKYLKIFLVIAAMISVITACGSRTNEELSNLSSSSDESPSINLSIDSAVTAEITGRQNFSDYNWVAQYCTYTNHTDKEVTDLKVDLLVKDAFGDTIVEREADYYKGDDGGFELLPYSSIETEFGYQCNEYNFYDQKYYNTDNDQLDIQLIITGIVFSDGTVLTT